MLLELPTPQAPHLITPPQEKIQRPLRIDHPILQNHNVIRPAQGDTQEDLGAQAPRAAQGGPRARWQGGSTRPVYAGARR